MCAHTLLLNSIIHFTFADEKQDAYQYMDKEFSNIRIVDIAKMAGGNAPIIQAWSGLPCFVVAGEYT